MHEKNSGSIFSLTLSFLLDADLDRHAKVGHPVEDVHGLRCASGVGAVRLNCAPNE